MTLHSPISRIAPLAAVALVLAIAASCSKDNPMAPSGPLAPGTAIVYDAVGASDAAGVGSSVVCVPFTDCPTGMGYPQVATRQLKAQGFNTSLVSLGFPTAAISPAFEALGHQFGRTIVFNFLEQEMPFVRKDATLVTIFAGGNDVTTVTAALGGGAGASDQAGYIDSQVKAFGADYQTLLNGIRGRAGAARIVALNVPNLGGLPFLAGASLAERQAAQRISVSMTKTVVNALTSQGVIVIDLMCDSRSYMPSNISSDGFHPNDAGYAFIAGEVVRAATSGSYAAPQSNCGLMTTVP